MHNDGDRIFKWGIIGASNIAVKFCNAISLMEGCEVAAIGSNSLERATKYAGQNSIPAAFGSYEQMLREIKPDAVYIATATGNHYDACKLCLQYSIPFLCEKTMCIDSLQTKDVFDEAARKRVFCMEAMWSRFLPMVLKAKEWIETGRIGDLKFGEISLGFCAERDNGNRFWNPRLGGGAAWDLLVYGYEIIRLLIDKPITGHRLSVIESGTGVDASEVLVLEYPDMTVVLSASLETFMNQSVVVRGSKGNIIIPNILFGNEVLCYDNENKVVERYSDTITQNGFVYEIKEVMDCIKKGKLQSDTVPHNLTLDFAKICDEILEKVREKQN